VYLIEAVQCHDIPLIEIENIELTSVKGLFLPGISSIRKMSLFGQGGQFEMFFKLGLFNAELGPHFILSFLVP
jgi:hypothetical protein